MSNLARTLAMAEAMRQEFGGPGPAKAPKSNSTVTIDPAPLIAAYWERIAIVAEAGTMSDAVRIATSEVGSPIAALARRQFAVWQEKIAAITDPADPALAGLKSQLLTEVEEAWMREAAEAGWTDVELFGLDPHDPIRNFDGQGVACLLALGMHGHADTWSRVRIVRTDRIVATLPDGRVSQVLRFAAGIDRSVPVWEIPAFTSITRH
jgi:hypothetical protein